MPSCRKKHPVHNLDRIIGVFAVLLLFSCSGREDGGANLSSVTVNTNTLILPPGGSARIEFSVNDPDFEFNHLVSSHGCQVKLMLSGGLDPEEFGLESVEKADGAGRYCATIADSGTGESFERSVSVAVYTAPGSSEYVSSRPFTVKNENDPAGSVKTGLPIVYVNTISGGNISSKTEFADAEIYIRGTSSLPDMETAPCRIRGRGNTTWYWPKKPYLIALDKRQSVLGMPEHKRWVLLANFMDRTLMRNMVAMKVSSMTRLAWTPRCVPVELVLNGKHQGTYLLIEQVRVDENRVNISETDGYIFELDFHYDNAIQWKDHGIPFSVKHPDEDDITQEQISYAKSYIAEVAGAIYGSSFSNPQNGYAKYLDVDSFIDYWIVYEVMTNHELGNPGSVMFHKDPAGLLTAGPCWDFDWGVLSFYTSGGEYGLVNGNAIWYARLFQDPDFKAKVKARFQELKPQLETVPDYMDECEALLEKSAGLNFKMWNPAEDKSMNGGNIINGDENLSFHDAVKRLKSNYLKHLQIIETKL